MMTATTETERPRRRRRRGLVAASLVLGLVAVLAVGQATGLLWVLPPSTQDYGAYALDAMESGGIAVDRRTWPEVRRAAEAEIDRAPDRAATYPALTRALAAAGGPHSRFFPAGTSLADADDGLPAMPVLRTDSGVTTLALPGLVADDPTATARYASGAADGLRRADAATSSGWVVDLRANTGGNMWPMLAGISDLLPDGPAMAFVDRDGGRYDVVVDGNRVRSGQRVNAEVAPGPPLRPRPVAVLQGPRTGSSGEAVLLSLRGLPGVRTFGTDSAGYSSANTTTVLDDGASMLLTTALDADRSGRVWGGAIPPDQATGAPEEPARAWLAQQCAGW